MLKFLFDTEFTLWFFLRIISIHSNNHMLVLFFILFWITVQAMCLIAPLLPPLCLRIEIIFSAIWLQVHT